MLNFAADTVSAHLETNNVKYMLCYTVFIKISSI